MKKMLMVGIAVMLASCAPRMQGPTVIRDAVAVSGSLNGEVIQVETGLKNWVVTRPEYQISVDFAPGADAKGSYSGTQGFTLKVQNRSNNVLKVNWDESAIAVNGQTGGIIPDGVKYIDAERSKPPLIIPPGVTTTKEIVPAASISYREGRFGGWSTAPLFAKSQSTVSLLLTLEHAKKDVLNINFASSR